MNRHRLAKSINRIIASLAGCLAVGGFAQGDAESASDKLNRLAQILSNTSWKLVLHPQFDSLSSDLSLDSLQDPDTHERDFMRRLMFGFGTKISDSVRIDYLTDYSDRVVGTQYARLKWTWDEMQTLTIGYQKAPFLFEDTLSSSLVKPIERSASTRFWNEYVRLGSYHAGVFYERKGEQLESRFGLCHNETSETAVPDVLDGDVSLYASFRYNLELPFGTDALFGADIGYQPSDERDVAAATVYGATNLGGYDLLAEAVFGRIASSTEDTSTPFSWHLQASRFLGESFELVGRLSELRTDSFGAGLGPIIRKAPNSGFQYDVIDSVYFGANYYVNGNAVKLSAGYELAQGRHPVRSESQFSELHENVSGFRIRGQLVF